MRCEECLAYASDKRQCHRFPIVVEKLGQDWCLEFRAKEVIQDAVEERKIEESSVSEHQRVDALWPASEASGSNSDEQGGQVQKQEETVKRRGWPKGKPRKPSF